MEQIPLVHPTRLQHCLDSWAFAQERPKVPSKAQTSVQEALN